MEGMGECAAKGRGEGGATTLRLSCGGWVVVRQGRGRGRAVKEIRPSSQPTRVPVERTGGTLRPSLSPLSSSAAPRFVRSRRGGGGGKGGAEREEGGCWTCWMEKRG